MDEKQKFIGGINFDELRAQRVQVYNEIVLDLSVARTNVEHIFTGTYIYASEATDVDANVSVRFNELFRANIKLVQGRGIRCPFYRFYLTNTAQAGKTLTLVIGIESADFEIFDVGKALGITGFVNTVASPRSGHTQVATSSLVTGAIHVLHTVTAGKTFYLVGAFLNGANSGAAAALGTLYVTNAADALQYIILYHELVSIVGQFIGKDSSTYNPAIPLEIPAGYKIKLESTGAAFNAYGFIQGYEV